MYTLYTAKFHNKPNLQRQFFPNFLLADRFWLRNIITDSHIFGSRKYSVSK